MVTCDPFLFIAFFVLTISYLILLFYITAFLTLWVERIWLEIAAMRNQVKIRKNGSKRECLKQQIPNMCDFFYKRS
ncbi:MAG: hypothetical protein AYK19_06750 [Theionarchaea archaeon DG-70-1]|nr:MAG: hypothetical protein AYK19_06750 [Theionarchaea archaeon DG-70-1]